MRSPRVMGSFGLCTPSLASMPFSVTRSLFVWRIPMMIFAGVVVMALAMAAIPGGVLIIIAITMPVVAMIAVAMVALATTTFAIAPFCVLAFGTPALAVALATMIAFATTTVSM